MNRKQTYRGTLEAIDRILNRGGDADDVLRAVVDLLHGLYPWVGILFVEEDGLVPGPEAGAAVGAQARYPISYQGRRVAELVVSGSGGDDDERAFLERVATLVSAYCLVGWDTGGVPWDEVGG
jgi:hypothetical protein